MFSVSMLTHTRLCNMTSAAILLHNTVTVQCRLHIKPTNTINAFNKWSIYFSIKYIDFFLSFYLHKGCLPHKAQFLDSTSLNVFINMVIKYRMVNIISMYRIIKTSYEYMYLKKPDGLSSLLSTQADEPSWLPRDITWYHSLRLFGLCLS